MSPTCLYPKDAFKYELVKISFHLAKGERVKGVSKPILAQRRRDEEKAKCLAASFRTH